jgi:sigma-B regulation protein RsbU (phosphoserine phosphatase)
MCSIVAAEEASPSAALARLNRALVVRRIQPRFATLTYGVLAPDGVFTYANAGHHPPLLVTPTTVTPLTQGGPILGVFPDAAFPEASVQLAPGDTVIAVSDGIIEAEAPDGSDFGMDRLLRIVAAHRADAADRLVGHLLEEVRRFCGGIPPGDDVTVAAATYRGNESKAVEVG